MDRVAWRSVVHGVTESDVNTDVQASIYWTGQKVHSIFFHKILQKNPYKVTFWPTQYLCIYLSTIYLSTHAYLQQSQQSLLAPPSNRAPVTHFLMTCTSSLQVCHMPPGFHRSLLPDFCTSAQSPHSPDTPARTTS